jgi:hypothetical protein
VIRFRRSFKIFPGVRLHVGLRGIGISGRASANA